MTSRYPFAFACWAVLLLDIHPGCSGLGDSANPNGGNGATTRADGAAPPKQDGVAADGSVAPAPPSRTDAATDINAGFDARLQPDRADPLSGDAPRTSADASPMATDTGAASPDPEPGRLAGVTRMHNAARAQVGVPDLIWDPTLAATAQAYANKCVYQHSGAPNLGENIAANTPANVPVSAPMKDWAGEKADYDYNTNSCVPNKQCGHYTQIVWKTTKRLGCAVTICPANSSPFASVSGPWDFWVCNFAPPGNYVGQKPY